MTPSQVSSSTDARPEPFSWSRLDTAQAFADFSDPLAPPRSQRQYAREHDIPRSSLGHWLRKDFPDHLDPAFVCFFRRPAGHAFLRRLVLSLLLVFHHQNACGLRQISHFLRLAELDHFVGSSYGALYDLDLWLQTDLDHFAQQQRQQLAAAMPAKDIILCPDENFHGTHVCLVAIEPVSNFILVETYRDKRDSITWAKAINEGVKGLPVHVVSLTSDQASGLTCCASKELQVSHNPDLLHLQQDLLKPILLPLARPIRQARKDLEKAKREEKRLEQAEQKKPGSVTVEMYVTTIEAEEQAKKNLGEATRRLDGAVQPVREVSRVYHPFDRESGQAVTAEQMQTRLSEPIQHLQKVVEDNGLPERAQQAVQKAQQWVVLLVGCLAWFWTTTQRRVQKLGLSQEAEQLVQALTASCYWEMASDKEKDPEERKRLKALAGRLKEQAWAKGGALAALPEERKKEAEREARQCAEMFQRSSSCVEGRNGRLSLFHHGQSRLSEGRLKALSAVHNYVLRREDGTTAAERFFGQEHPDAFSWLLGRMPDLPHPAAKRPKKPSGVCPVAA